MRRLAFLLALFCTAAQADLVARVRGDELRLLPAACTSEVILARINEEYRSQFRKAQASIGGQTFYGCWIDTHQGAYVVAWQDGDLTTVPVTAFVEIPGA